MISYAIQQKLLQFCLLTTIAFITCVYIKPIAFGTSVAVIPQEPDFLTTWKTDNPGVSPNNEVWIPITGGGYNYNLDCNNDGVYEFTNKTDAPVCVYASPGEYQISITGDFPRIYFNNSGDKEKLLRVDQWGLGAWTSMEGAFWGVTNLEIKDLYGPNLTNATSMESMFRGVTNLSGANINEWSTVNIENMNYVFYDATNFNESLSKWDTDNVTSAIGMFQNATNFNQSIKNWNVGNIALMDNMFQNATNFNQTLGDWNMTSVTSAVAMLSGANLSTANYDDTLTDWSMQVLNDAVSFGAGSTQYCISRNDRASIVANYNWTIEDGGDSACASVVNVTSSTIDGTYKAGDVIVLQIQFNAPVVVTGNPILHLNSTFRGEPAYAVYTSGSNTNVLTFNYTVLHDHGSSDLAYSSTAALNLNGGSITTFSNGAMANTSLPLPGAVHSLSHNKAIVISAPKPPVISNVVVTTTNTSATVVFDTDEESNATYKLGLTDSLEYFSSLRFLTFPFSGYFSHSNTFNNLLPCTTYYYQIYAYDRHNYEGKSSILQLRTSGCSTNADVIDRLDTTYVLNASGASSLHTPLNLLHLNVPANFNTTNATCPTGAYFQIHQVSDNNLTDELGKPGNAASVHAFELAAYCNANTPITTFDEPLELTFYYTELDALGIDTLKLQGYWYNDVSSSWQALECTNNVSAKTVTCTTTHFSLFGLFAPPSTAETPVITSSNGGCRGSNCRSRSEATHYSSSMSRLSDPSPFNSNNATTQCDSSTLSQTQSYLSVSTNTFATTFYDVPVAEWFACAVHSAVTANIVSGYKHSDGTPTGYFKPNNTITYAEMLKLAYLVSGNALDDTEGLVTTNRSARDHWAHQLVAYAEQQNISTFIPVVNINHFATRGEFLQTIYELLGSPSANTIDTFIDVSPDYNYYDAIMYADSQGWVTGDTDDTGKPLQVFRPDQLINRAEAVTIVNRILTH